MMVGNIGTGKSTTIRRYVDKGYLVVSRDSIRYMLGGGKYLFEPTRVEPTVFVMEHSMLCDLMGQKFNIVVDEVGIDKRMRAPYIALGKAFNYNVIAHTMPRLSKRICVSRRLKANHGETSKQVWEEVWDKFQSRFEVPSKQEGFSVIRRHRA